MFDFNSILSATEAKVSGSPAVIVSENHNTSSINWVAGLSDPGEMIGCGMYQQLRRLANESDTAYAARLNVELATVPADVRAKIETAMRSAAIRRASLDTSNGRVNVMVVGEPAWHALGVNVRDAVNSAQAIQLAGLDWAVMKLPVSYVMPDGRRIDSVSTFALVRGDTGDELGSVGSVYQPIQNVDGFAFLDDVIGDYGAKFHTAGSVYGGKKVWMQCELPEQSFEVVAGDEVQAFATFTNPHDATGRAFCFPTTNRIVCANTFRTASTERGKGIGIRHSGNVKASIQDAKKALGLTIEGINTFREHSYVMARTPVDAPQFFNDLLDEVLDLTAADALKGSDALAAALKVTEAQREAESKRIDRQLRARENIREDILSRYEGQKNGVNGIRGTQWSAFNAVTEHADYSKPRRAVGTATEQIHRRFESVLTGDADDLKQTAYTMLTGTTATR